MFYFCRRVIFGLTAMLLKILHKHELEDLIFYIQWNIVEHRHFACKMLTLDNLSSWRPDITQRSSAVHPT